MFKINEVQANLKNINPRAENHGGEHALACDISLEFTVSNKMLDSLDEGLLGFLYRREQSAEDEAQGHLDMEEGMLPHLRYKLLGPLTWKYEGAGYTFQLIEDKLHGEEVIEIPDCKVNKFKIECEEGGTIKLGVQVQGNPTEDTIGELCHYLKEDVIISLIPPSRPVEENPDQVGIEEQAADTTQEDDEPRPDDEAMYTVAVEHVRDSGNCTITNLQKAMQIGYNRAARLIERMEKDGVITSMSESGVRVVVAEEGEPA